MMWDPFGVLARRRLQERRTLKRFNRGLGATSPPEFYQRLRRQHVERYLETLESMDPDPVLQERIDRLRASLDDPKES